MIPFDKLLNPEQLAAATAADGPLLVLAAAGTGKTRTLVYRVAYLAEQGIPADALLLLTFTNRAAREMMMRAGEVAGGLTGGIWSGTFHHVCNRFLRRHADRIGFQHDFTILDRDDACSIIDECIKALKLNRKEFPRRDVLASLFSAAANRCVPVANVIEASMDELNVDPMDIVRVHEGYELRKQQLGAMDFDDLLVNGLRLLREQEAVCRNYQLRFRHILVDEYQDTNLLQAQLVDLLGAHHRNVMVVGDDFQSIYGWRGADFRNIMEFPKRYPDCRIVKLERNYRSVPEILEVANACIAGNPLQFQKTLRATRPSRVKPRVLFLRDGDEQAKALVRLVQRHLEDGFSLGQMAVLYRAHFHSIELQMELSRAGIPYTITSGVGVFEQAHVKDVLSFLRVCCQPNDYLAFTRLLGMLYGVGPKAIEGYWAKLGGRFSSQDAQQRAALCAMIKPAARADWSVIDRLLEEFHREGLARNGGEIVARFFDRFLHAYLQRVYENADKRADDIQELAVQIMQSPDVPAFLSEVALLTNVDHAYDRRETPDAPDQLQLSTVHQAKGMEWPVLFVIWATEGMFPSSRTLGESGDDAEERRLFYVAVTRARDELCLCAPEMRRTRDGGVFFCKPSRFIKELPRGLLRESYGMQGEARASSNAKYV
ncbi:MAG: ATP-dependent helicase [bacterium]